MPVIMMSGHATIDTAVEATKIGASAFLEKPITLQKLLKAVEQGLARNNASAKSGPAQPPRTNAARCQHGHGAADDCARASAAAAQNFALD